MGGLMRVLTKKKTQWKEDIFFAVKFARQKLLKEYTEVTPKTVKLVISARNLDCLRKFRLFRKWYKGLVINTKDETSFTTRCQEAFLKYMENEY
jgi:hypothetical protein